MFLRPAQRAAAELATLRRLLFAVLIGGAAAFVSFLVINVAGIAWESWGAANTAQVGIGEGLVSLVIAPAIGLLTFLFVLTRPVRDSSAR